MKSWFALEGVKQIGLTVANRSLWVSAGLLATCTVIAYAVDYAGLALPGRSGDRNPFIVLLRALGLALLLLCYGTIVAHVSQTAGDIATTMSAGSSFEKFAAGLGPAIEAKFAVADKSLLQIAADYSTGILGTALTVLGMVIAMVLLQLFYGMQAVMLSILVAVGPLAIACSILPGASGLFGKWLRGLIELACWPILGTIVLEMAMKAGVAQLYQDSAANWLMFLGANVLLVASVASVPMIASQLVGGGFGAVGPMMGSVAQRGAALAGGLLGGGARGALAGALKREAQFGGKVSNAAGALGRAVMRGTVMQPPANGPAQNAGAREAIMTGRPQNTVEPPKGQYE